MGMIEIGQTIRFFWQSFLIGLQDENLPESQKEPPGYFLTHFSLNSFEVLVVPS